MLVAAPGFLVAVAAILVAGPRMARTADRLADVTGMGGALFGVVFLALATDLPEVTLTPTAVLSGSPRIAVGNLIGSAAAQLTLVAIVDLTFRRGKLLAQAPLLSSLGPCALMLAVLAPPLLVAASNPTAGWVGLGTLLLVAAYLGTLAAVRGVGDDQEDPTPGPHEREEVMHDEAVSTGTLWRRFAGYAVVLALAGVGLEAATEALGSRIGLGETAAGALLAGIATSLPELVTSIAAARIGALGLVVGDLVGSSALDVALLAWADVFYTDGSIFELFGGPELTLLGVCLGLTAVLVLGLARRTPVERPAVTAETYLMLGTYALGVVVLFTAS